MWLKFDYINKCAMPNTCIPIVDGSHMLLQRIKLHFKFTKKEKKIVAQVNGNKIYWNLKTCYYWFDNSNQLISLHVHNL